MFEVGDFIIHGTSGVCKVEKVGAVDLPGISKERKYYTLEPVYTQGNKLFIPVDSNKVVLRPVITQKQAYDLIDDMKQIEGLGILDDKKRDVVYKEALHKCDCIELVKIIKTVHEYRKARLAEGKKATANDDRYFNIAEERLYGELAIPLGMTKEEVKDFIIDRLSSTVEHEAS